MSAKMSQHTRVSLHLDLLLHKNGAPTTQICKLLKLGSIEKYLQKVVISVSVETGSAVFCVCENGDMQQINILDKCSVL